MTTLDTELLTTTEPQPSTLAYLHWVLDNLGYDTDRIFHGEITEQPYEQLLLSVAKNAKGEDLILRLISAEDVFNSISPSPAPEGVTDTFQFVVNMPLKISGDQVEQVTHLAGALNRFVPFGAFAFNEAEGLCFRYSLITLQGQVPAELIVETIESTGFFIEKWHRQPFLE